jgi:hypothetical protein
MRSGCAADAQRARSVEVEGITDLLLQVTKAADTADTTVTHSYY